MGNGVDLSRMNRAELVQFCIDTGVTITAGMTPAEILTEIEMHGVESAQDSQVGSDGAEQENTDGNASENVELDTEATGAPLDEDGDATRETSEDTTDEPPVEESEEDPDAPPIEQVPEDDESNIVVCPECGNKRKIMNIGQWLKTSEYAAMVKSIGYTVENIPGDKRAGVISALNKKYFPSED